MNASLAAPMLARQYCGDALAAENGALEQVEKISAEDDLRMQIRAIRKLGGDQGAVDATIARNVLHEDLGYYDAALQDYNLNEATRDRLLVHARQDASHAVIAVGTLEGEVRRLRRMLAVYGVISILLMSAILISFWT